MPSLHGVERNGPLQVVQPWQGQQQAEVSNVDISTIEEKRCVDKRQVLFHGLRGCFVSRRRLFRQPKPAVCGILTGREMCDWEHDEREVLVWDLMRRYRNHDHGCGFWKVGVPWSWVWSVVDGFSTSASRRLHKTNRRT